MVKALEISWLALKVNWIKGIRGIVLVTLIASTGCNPSNIGHSDSPQARQQFRQASKLRQTGNYAAAITSFEQASRLNPDWAEPHLELGLLYEEKLRDPISAIYHYRRYVKLQPDTSRQHLVEDFIERSTLSLATTLPTLAAFSDTALDARKIATENSFLSKENERLHSRIRELEKKPINAAMIRENKIQSTSPISNIPERYKRTESSMELLDIPTNVSMRSYEVKRGDTLQSLALRFYGSRSAWEKIYEINRAILPGKDTLKVGQILIIP